MLKVCRIIFVIVYSTAFLALFFCLFVFFQKHAVPDVRLHGRFHFNSTLLKVVAEQQLTEFQRISNQISIHMLKTITE